MTRALLTLLGVLSLARAAHAKQIIVAEAEYTHSAQTTQDSHYRVEPTPETPPDWTQPVDYAHGSVHVRLEVKTKPTATPTRYQVCFEMKQSYCCTEQAPSYTTAGTYEWDTPVEQLWRPGPVDFAQGIARSALILKDTNNLKPAPENVGEATSNLYMPTELRVIVTLVSSGDAYSNGDEPDPAGGGEGGSGAGTGSAGATTLGGAGAGGKANAGTDGSGSDPGGAAGSAPVSTASAGSGGVAITTAGGAAIANDAAASASSSCSVRVPAENRSSAWLLAALLLAARRRRTPNG